MKKVVVFPLLLVFFLIGMLVSYFILDEYVDNTNKQSEYLFNMFNKLSSYKDDKRSHEILNSDIEMLRYLTNMKRKDASLRDVVKENAEKVEKKIKLMESNYEAISDDELRQKTEFLMKIGNDLVKKAKIYYE